MRTGLLRPAIVKHRCQPLTPRLSRLLAVPGPSGENGLEGIPSSMSPRSRHQKICSLLVFFCVCLLSVNARSKDIPAHGPAIVLFDGKDLSQFDTFLRSAGLNSDPNHVFVVENGAVHVSGTEFGYFITKQEYKDYYLRAEFKWGVGTFAPRQGQARDSGILYNIQGPNKVWPRSVEFQINEGCTGDFWMTDGAALTGIGPDGKAGPASPARKAKHPGSTASTRVKSET